MMDGMNVDVIRQIRDERDALAKRVNELEAQTAWTPCSERLPKRVGDYLVTTHSGQIARYIYVDTDTSKEYWMRCAVAWMPLPKPWKGGSHERR